MKHTQLLCTFCTEDTLNETVKKVINTYKVSFDSIYVLKNTEDGKSLCLTYNVEVRDTPLFVPESTISLHRKKSSNTLYTINALNLLITELNNGKFDKSYKVKWDDYKNTILVTAYSKLKKIQTELKEIIKVSEFESAYRDS